MGFDVFEYTNKGGRSYNEDYVKSSYSNDKGIFIVADGLGGHLLGEEASRLAAETIAGFDFSSRVNVGLHLQLRKKIIEANTEILRLQKEKNATMKTTVAALAICRERAVWANTGDSRVYHIRSGELLSCTEDHSVAYKKYKVGEITREQIATDEDQSRLLRSLGSEDRFEPTFYEPDNPIGTGDAFFLCSDGAWEYLSDVEILIDYLRAEDSRQWAEHMMLRMLERVKDDNDNFSMLTVMIV